ncbi:MAG: hypothetical protein GY860_25970 [Desulfobacteraceae bacterium]|nr:hypothetical protein [Desulfobacteraceae bacterium]
MDWAQHVCDMLVGVDNADGLIKSRNTIVCDAGAGTSELVLKTGAKISKCEGD